MSEELKSPCGHIEKWMEDWEHPLEIATLTNLTNGKQFPQFIMRGHHVSDDGRVSNAEKGRTWVKIHNCPWCGVELPISSDAPAPPDEKKGIKD